jgi:hypothetical protein
MTSVTELKLKKQDLECVTVDLECLGEAECSDGGFRVSGRSTVW